MLDAEKAKKELKEKTYDQIQVETAWTWGSRAAASFENVLTAARSDKVSLFMLGQEYLHEAVEHAALAEDPSLLEELKIELASYVAEAVEDLDSYLDIEV